MRNPQDALNRLWDILKDLYGDPREFLDNTIRGVKWTKEPFVSRVSSLQSYRTQLRNLEGVARSIDIQEELTRLKLLFRNVNCFNPTLYNLFTQVHRDFRAWRFKTILTFLDDQISNLQFRERHTYNMSAIIGKDNRSRNPDKPAKSSRT